MDLLAALTAEGVDVRPESDWATRTARRKFAPVGIIIHHTGGGGEGGFRIIRDGRSDLPGPLANLHPRKDGSVHLLTGGMSNHAGPGDPRVLAHTRMGQLFGQRPSAKGVVGNQWYYGIEIENLGTGRDPYPEVQLDATVKCVAAICRMHDWSASRVIGHKEWTSRKVDPSFDMGAFRNRVAAALGQAPLANPEAPTQIDHGLLDRAAALGLFAGDPAYYHEDGAATADERNHLVNVLFQGVVDRLETLNQN